MYELYKEHARYYDVIYREYLEKSVPKVVDFLEQVFREDAKRKVVDVLDLACGTGAITIELARRGYRVTGVDLNEEVLEIAQEKARRKKLTIKFLKADAAEIDFKESFDAATMIFSSICYIPEERICTLMEKVARALRPGGIFVADMPNHALWLHRFSPLARRSTPDVWSAEAEGERLAIIDWQEADDRDQTIRFKRYVQIVGPDGSVKAFFMDDKLVPYTPRELRFASRGLFSEVKTFADLKRELPRSARRFWMILVK